MTSPADPPEGQPYESPEGRAVEDEHTITVPANAAMLPIYQRYVRAFLAEHPGPRALAVHDLSAALTRLSEGAAMDPEDLRRFLCALTDDPAEHEQIRRNVASAVRRLPAATWPISRDALSQVVTDQIVRGDMADFETKVQALLADED